MEFYYFGLKHKKVYIILVYSLFKHYSNKVHTIYFITDDIIKNVGHYVDAFWGHNLQYIAWV